MWNLFGLMIRLYPPHFMCHVTKIWKHFEPPGSTTSSLFFPLHSPQTPKMKKGTARCYTCSPFWRRGRDSNPRYPCGYTAFRVRPVRPLRHLSRDAKGKAFFPYSKASSSGISFPCFQETLATPTRSFTRLFDTLTHRFLPTFNHPAILKFTPVSPIPQLRL